MTKHYQCGASASGGAVPDYCQVHDESCRRVVMSEEPKASAHSQRIQDMQLRAELGEAISDLMSQEHDVWAAACRTEDADHLERYHWLRKHSFATPAMSDDGCTPMIEFGAGFNQCAPEFLDAAIDAARGMPSGSDDRRTARGHTNTVLSEEALNTIRRLRERDSGPSSLDTFASDVIEELMAEIWQMNSPVIMSEWQNMERELTVLRNAAPIHPDELRALFLTRLQHRELLASVFSKFPGESRFETALRYIRETEARVESGTDHE